MKKILASIVLPWITLLAMAQYIPYRDYINLAGEWGVWLSPSSISEAVAMDKMPQSVRLPGTTDTNGIGNPPQSTDETTHLTRLHSFVGTAVYSRDLTIPDNWKGKSITLTLERTKPTQVFVDGIKMGENNDITTPQVYDLTRSLTPGSHHIAVVVDNGESVPPQLLSNSHAYTEDTQTNWNGIIGNMYLDAVDNIHISSMRIEPDAQKREVTVSLTIAGAPKAHSHIIAEATPRKWNGKIRYADLWTERGKQHYTVTIPLGEEAHFWDEFHPDLYDLCVTLEGYDEQHSVFGLVDFRVDDHHFVVNGHETFLRGKHDACVFPLNAHVPMDRQAWLDYLGKCRSYGINHVRFHSWCPPEAAFDAADELGIYLQPELPFWGDFNPDDTRLMTFLHKEGEHIFSTYGHHPSFVMFALGNELWGAIDKMKEFVDDFRLMAPHKLFTFGSNYYLGYQGVKPGMDYFTTCRVGGEEWGKFDTHTRGSFAFADTYDGGIINHSHPGTLTNFKDACAKSTVPVISHETAQFQTYPDYDEIRKYTGVLYPYNMQVFYKRLVQAGLASQAKDFHRASGMWSLQLYKADVEMDMRTPNMAGFQLLDLQDYPGQGSAYVGVLDALMEEKTFMKENDGSKVWRSFCNQVVPLLETERFCYASNEILKGHIKLFNYGSGEEETKFLDGKLEWVLAEENEDIVWHGFMDIPENCHGLVDVGDIAVDLSDIDSPMRLNLSLYAYINASKGEFTNSYPIWVYPAEGNVEKLKKDIIVTHNLDAKVACRLNRGASVLWMPNTTEFQNNVVGGLFQTDYWNYRMFKTISENNHRPVSPGTLGILTNPEHPLLADFPTEFHSNWQWFPVVKASTPMILDNLPQDYLPIVQVIDNIERNHKLGLVFEFAVGKGRLLVCMSDLERASEYVEGRQFYLSLLRYMHSPQFQPQFRFKNSEELMGILHRPIQERKLEELNNISPY